MYVTPESVASFKEWMTEPSKFDLPIRPLSEMFKESETVTASHIIFQQADQEYKRSIPKIFFYIVMEQVYGQAVHKDSRGDLGYKMEYVPKRN